MITLLTAFEIIDKRIDSGIYHPEMEYPNFKDPQRKEKTLTYLAQQKEKETLFKTDLLEAYDLQDHPKGQRAFEIAWDMGHSNGLYEVLKNFDSLSQLLAN